MTLAEQYEALYDESVPRDLGIQFLQLLSRHYERAFDFVEARWQEPEARVMLGDVRRADLEQDLRAVRIPGVTTSVEKTAGGFPYTTLRVGRLVVTSSNVETSGSMPRDADFRTSNAEERQSDFWLKRPDPQKEVFAILAHGGFGRQLTFAHVGFPDRTVSQWLHRVDLRRKYPDAWGELNNETVKPIAPTGAVTILRKDRKA